MYSGFNFQILNLQNKAKENLKGLKMTILPSNDMMLQLHAAAIPDCILLSYDAVLPGR